jgi:hypothetical protein
MSGVMTYRMIRLRVMVLLLVIGAAAIACNQTPEGRLPVHPVKGKVLYKGSPLAEALVIFEKEELCQRERPPPQVRDQFAPREGQARMALSSS